MLHIYSAEENQALFRRLYSALSPGGRLIIQDVFLHDREGLYPEEASLFAVSMLLVTPAGNTYSFSETAEWLRAAGFVRIRPLRMKKGTEDWDGGCWRRFVRPEGKRAPAPEDHEEKIKQAASECQCQDRRAGEAWLASWTIVERSSARAIVLYMTAAITTQC